MDVTKIYVCPQNWNTLSPCGKTLFFNELKQNKEITELSIDFSCFTCDELKQFTESLNVEVRLSSVCFIGGMHLLSSSSPFQRNLEHLRVLDVSRNVLFLDGVTQLFSDHNLNSLESLNLSHTALSCESFVFVCEKLKSFKSLRELHLDNLNLGSFDIDLLCSLLACNGTITTLSLGYTSLDDSRGSKIIASLSKSKTLNVLRLYSNDIEGDPVILISKWLENEMCSLHELDLSRNKITCMALKSLFGSIKMNCSLHTLLMDWTITNECFNDVLPCFREAVKFNVTLWNVSVFPLDLDQNIRLELEVNRGFRCRGGYLDRKARNRINSLRIRWNWRNHHTFPTPFKKKVWKSADFPLFCLLYHKRSPSIGNGLISLFFFLCYSIIHWKSANFPLFVCYIINDHLSLEIG